MSVSVWMGTRLSRCGIRERGKNACAWANLVSPNTKTTYCIPAARGLVPGPTHHAITPVHNMESSIDLFFTAKIINIIVNTTNLHRRRSVAVIFMSQMCERTSGS